jgi:hypothetical protein
VLRLLFGTLVLTLAGCATMGTSGPSEGEMAEAISMTLIEILLAIFAH